MYYYGKSCILCKPKAVESDIQSDRYPTNAADCPQNTPIVGQHNFDFMVSWRKLRFRQWRQLPPHAWFSLVVTVEWDTQPLHRIHHSAEYHRSAGAAWRQGGLLVNHTDTLSRPKGGQSLNQPTNPKKIHQPSSMLLGCQTTIVIMASMPWCSYFDNK